MGGIVRPIDQEMIAVEKIVYYSRVPKSRAHVMPGGERGHIEMHQGQSEAEGKESTVVTTLIVVSKKE